MRHIHTQFVLPPPSAGMKPCSTLRVLLLQLQEIYRLRGDMNLKVMGDGRNQWPMRLVADPQVPTQILLVPVITEEDTTHVA